MNSTVKILRYVTLQLSTALLTCSDYLAEIELPAGSEKFTELQGIIIPKVRNPETGRMILANGHLAKRLVKKGLLPI